MRSIAPTIISLFESAVKLMICEGGFKVPSKRFTCASVGSLLGIVAAAKFFEASPQLLIFGRCEIERGAELLINGIPSKQDVVSYMEIHMDELSQPHRYLGAWVAEGKTFLNVQEVHQDRTVALAVAHKRDEIAAYDLASGDSLYTMSDKSRPSENKPGATKITKAQIETRAAAYTDKMRQIFGKPKLILFGKDQTPEQIVSAIKEAHEN